MTHNKAALMETLRATATVLEENPYTQAPQKVEVTTFDLSRYDLEQLAAVTGQPVVRSNTYSWVTVPLTTMKVHGIQIDYIAYGTTGMDWESA